MILSENRRYNHTAYFRFNDKKVSRFLYQLKLVNILKLYPLYLLIGPIVPRSTFRSNVIVVCYNLVDVMLERYLYKASVNPFRWSTKPLHPATGVRHLWRAVGEKTD